MHSRNCFLFLDNIPSGRYAIYMNTDASRKKQPEAAKRQLLDAAAAIAVDCGLGAITLEAVARGAGVSKGGLLHHYPNRQALVQALAADILAKVDARILGLMQRDPEPRGRFSRAYLLAVTTAEDNSREARLMGALALAMFGDGVLAALWAEWLTNSVVSHGRDENPVIGRIVRYAADGIWLDDASDTALANAEERAAVIARLAAMTRTM